MDNETNYKTTKEDLLEIADLIKYYYETDDIFSEVNFPIVLVQSNVIEVSQLAQNNEYKYYSRRLITEAVISPYGIPDLVRKMVHVMKKYNRECLLGSLSYIDDETDNVVVVSTNIPEVNKYNDSEKNHVNKRIDLQLPFSGVLYIQDSLSLNEGKTILGCSFFPHVETPNNILLTNM